MPAFYSAHGCTSTDGRDDVLGLLRSGGNIIGHMPRPSHFSEIDDRDIAVEPVHQAAPVSACESGEAVETSTDPAREPGHVTDKSLQVRLLTHHVASQANEKKTLSTSATQTEPQAVSSGMYKDLP
ncbi:hypothetical protein MTO96_048960 [Rhipicephalus appendiculatus]